MGAKPGVGMHQIGMRNAPQAGMAGICLGHGHGGNDNVLSVASQAGVSLQTPESACACRCVSSGSVCPLFLIYETLRHWLYGATAARLTPDQKVGSSNLSVVIFSRWRWDVRHLLLTTLQGLGAACARSGTDRAERCRSRRGGESMEARTPRRRPRTRCPKSGRAALVWWLRNLTGDD